MIYWTAGNFSAHIKHWYSGSLSPSCDFGSYKAVPQTRLSLSTEVILKNTESQSLHIITDPG